MIQIDLDDAELRRGLAALIRRLGDPSPALRDIGELLIERTRQRFRDGQDAAGNAWPALSETTLERRREAGISGTAPGIGESRQLSTKWSYYLDGDSLVFGSPMIQSAVFAFGAEARSFTGGVSPWGDIPARDPITPTEQTRRDILDIFAEHLQGAD
jgi:phage gpG-like protein